MTAIIGQVIQEFKSILSKMEEAIKGVVSEIGTYSQEAERRIEFILNDAFRRIKKDISDIIQRLEDKLRSLEKKKISTSVGSNASSFPQRIKNGLVEAGKDAEKLMTDFRIETEFFINECRRVVSSIGTGIEKTTTNTIDITRKAGEDLFHALDVAGKNALSSIERVSANVSKNIELDASFAFHHGVKLSEVPIAGALHPGFVGCVVLSGLAIVGASHWEPSPEIIDR